MKKPARVNAKQLTKYLRELSSEAHTIDDEGTMITKGEALARLIWAKALGGMIPILDDEGRSVMRFEKPATWAIELVYDRIEGKTPQTIEDHTGGMTAADRVSELAKTRLNNEAEASLTVSKHPGPVDLPDNGVEGSEGPGSESDLAS